MRMKINFQLFVFFWMCRHNVHSFQTDNSILNICCHKRATTAINIVRSVSLVVTTRHRCAPLLRCQNRRSRFGNFVVQHEIKHEISSSSCEQSERDKDALTHSYDTRTQTHTHAINIFLGTGSACSSNTKVRAELCASASNDTTSLNANRNTSLKPVDRNNIIFLKNTWWM